MTHLLLIVALAQDDLPTVIARLAQNAAKIDALEWHPRTWYAGRDYYDRGNTARGRFVRGEGVRFDVTIVNCSEPQEHRPEEGPNRFVVLWTPKDVSIALGLVTLEDGPGRGPPHLLMRAARDDASIKAVDPIFVNPLLPVLFVMNAPVLAVTLDPQTMLAFEPELRLAGRDAFDGRTCWKLESTRALGALDVPFEWYRVLDQTKRFFVDVETGELLAIVYDQTLRRPEGNVKVRVTSRVVERTSERLPRKIESVVEEEGATPAGWRQIIDYLPSKPESGSLTDWDADRTAPAGPITLGDGPSQLERMQHRALKSFGHRKFESQQQLTEFCDALDALAADLSDGGRGLMTKHWFIPRLRQDPSGLVRKALEAKSLAPNVLVYFAGSAAPADALALLDRAPRVHDPFLRHQMTVLRVRALVALNRAEEVGKVLAAAMGACGSFEEKLHLLWHVEKVGTPEAQVLAIAKENPREPIWAVAAALCHGRAKRHDEERLSLESLPDDGWSRHLYMRAAWRQLATMAPPELGIRLNRKMGPYGDGRRFEKSHDEAVRGRARAFAERMRAWAEEAKDDPRPGYLVALALVRAGEDGFWTWADRAVACEVPDDAISCNSGARAFAEVAALANARGDFDRLARAAKRWEETSVRSGWPDTEFLREHERNPLRLLAVRLIERRDWRRLFRVVGFGDAVHAGAVLSLNRFGALDVKENVRAALEELGASAPENDYRRGADYFLRFFPSSDATTRAALEVLEAAPKPGVQLLMDRATLAVRLREWERAARYAAEAYAQHDHHEGLVLYSARAHGLAGKAEEGRRMLAAFAQRHAVKRNYHWGLAFEQLGDYDSALAYYEKAERDGVRPHFRMGRLYERAQRWDDAMRSFNRALAGEPFAPGWAEEEMLPEPPARDEGWPSSPSEGRVRILAKLGENHYVEQLFKKPVELTAAEEKRVAGLVKTLADGSGDGQARRKAFEELREFGGRAAKAVHALVSSTDLYAAALARELLNWWAEPR